MTNQGKAILAVLARVLDYPDQLFIDEELKILSFLHEAVPEKEILDEAVKSLLPLYRLPLKDLQECYVTTFDHQEKTNLYLTAHELGDSRERGMALIGLQKLISECGFEYAGGELGDYLPMLLELLAVGPDGEKLRHLSRRIGAAIHRIARHLPDGNPYKAPVELLVKYMFEKPDEEEMARIEKPREKADLDELPYPLLYG